jgi:nitric-oxide synthase, bacterial
MGGKMNDPVEFRRALATEELEQLSQRLAAGGVGRSGQDDHPQDPRIQATEARDVRGGLARLLRLKRSLFDHVPLARGRSADPDAVRAGGPQDRAVDPNAADDFLRLYYGQFPDAGALRQRRQQVRAEIDSTGTYVHTPDELVYGARVAWRNSSRCIGRLYWQSLRVRDRRQVHEAEQVATEAIQHLREATNRGRVRPTITVFAPDTPVRRGPRIWNEQLIRYAGYEIEGGVVGDAGYIQFTELVVRLGWDGMRGTQFDVLPLVIEGPEEPPQLFDLPSDAVLEVPLFHPGHAWFAELGLRWHAIPVLSVMCLEIGGICYPAAPFNGWYMGTEIGARNLADTDRYNLLPVVAKRLGLDTSHERSLWRDRALVELNAAVLHSFDRAGVTITDHHTEAQRFLIHVAREARAGRITPADWSWIVPPMSGAATPVFHRYYDEADLRPNFVQHPAALARARGVP